MPGPALELVTARMFDFFGRRTSWHRRLWNGSLTTALAEAAELGERALDIDQGHEHLLTYRRFLRHEVNTDGGVSRPLREQLTPILTNRAFPAQAVRELRELVAQLRSSYFHTWQAAEVGDLPVERLSRALAAGLLDAGFSPTGLHRWLNGVVSRHPPETIADLMEAVVSRAALPDRTWSVVVPIERLPFNDHPRPGNYLDSSAAANRLPHPLPTQVGRVNGALVFEVSAKDASAAATMVGDLVARVVARVTVGLPGEAAAKLADVAWAKRENQGGEWAPLREPQRRLELGTLYRQSLVFELPDHARRLDDAFQLLATVETGSPGPAVAGAWAAIESLLRGPGERGGEIAAERMARVVACSLPRAELTTLAYQYQNEHQDPLADELRRCATNRERAWRLERAIKSQEALRYQKASDQAALWRVHGFLVSPPTLGRVTDYLKTAFLRLYRLRNLVMHGGSTDSIATAGVIGTMPPLVGAGIDRLAHGLLGTNPPTEPLALAARATVNLAKATKGQADSLSQLLEAP